MIGRRTVHAFALMTTLIAAQLAARSILAHVQLDTERDGEVAASH